MKKFILKILLFFVVFGLIFIIGILLPVTPGSKNNMISYKVQKDSMLRNVESPRIIFVGGSNLVFGLNSELIKDEFDLNPINAGLAINFGLIYMMDDVLPYVKSGDYVVLAPEYQHYFGDLAYGNNDLFRLLMDVERSGFKKLRNEQIPNLIKSMPTYFLSKFKPRQYFYKDKNDVYGNHIFNEYGDSFFHWGLEKREFPVVQSIKGNFNYALIKEINDFNDQIKAKGATLFVTYPGFQAASLDIVKNQVDKVQEELEKTGLMILGTPERYSMPDSLMFDQIYHLSKDGVDRRTKLLIEDLAETKMIKADSHDHIENLP